MEFTENEFIGMINQHKGLIYKVASAYTTGQEDRNDLIQDIMLQLWRSFENYDKQYKFSTWIYRIALNISISYLRKKDVRNKYHVPMDECLLRESVEEDKNSNEIDLYTILKSLNKYERALILMHFDGLSYSEIGSVLDITESNVGSKLTRIKKQLTSYVKEGKV